MKATKQPDLFPGVPEKPLDYDVYRRFAHDGDFALWKPRGFVGRLIAKFTDGPFCHASGIAWNHGRLWQYAYQEGLHGYGSPLSAEVRRNSGSICIFRVSGLGYEHWKKIAGHYIDDLTGDYQWKNIRLITYAHFLVNLLKLPRISDYYGGLVAQQARKTKGAICSQNIHRSIRKGSGIVLCPGRDESLVSPNDLGRALLGSDSVLSYIGTLQWPEGWKR